MSPDARAQYEKAMGVLDRNRNGVPDFMENMINTMEAEPFPPDDINT